MSRTPIYGLDIETDTSVDGLDPSVARVIAVAVSGPADEYFTGSEAALLTDLDERLASLRPGVIATWNGSGFDLPFLAFRAARLGISLGLRLREHPRPPRRQPMPGHAAAYLATWYQHRHLDALRLYRGDVGRSLRLSCSLKNIARFVGLSPVEVDRSRVHELSHEALHAYAASDARLARILTERRCPGALRDVDRLEPELTVRRPRPPRPRPEPTDVRVLPPVTAGAAAR